MKHKGGMFRAIFIVANLSLLTWSFSIQAVAPSDLVISKIQITGGTGLTTHDFVTIYNKTEAPIDLNGLRLVKRTKSGTSDTTLKSWISETLLNPGSIYTWANSDIASEINADTSSSQTIASDNGIALRQGSEDTGEIIDSVGWGAAENIFVEGSSFPTNPAGGQYLQRKDNLDTNNNADNFEIYPPEEEEEEEEEKETTTQQTKTIPEATGKDLIINELFVNPKNIDGQAKLSEFIEIYNKGTEKAAFDDWRIEIGEVVFELPRGTTLMPGSFTSIRDPKNIPLPNDGATVKLFAPERKTASQTITYKKAPDGMAWANFSAAWRWTAVPTPSQTNVLAQAPIAEFEILGVLLPGVPLHFDSSDSFTNNKPAEYLWDLGNGQTSVVQYPEYSFSKAGKYKISLTVKTEYGASETSKTITIVQNVTEKTVETSEQKIEAEPEEKPVSEQKIITNDNSIFTTAGLAIIPPDLFGVQYFYLLPEYGEPLLQIYNYNKLFPKIKTGDQLIVTGEYSELETGPRLKTKEAKDIQIIGQAEIDFPELTTSTEFTKPPYPRLAQVEGKVVSKKSPRIILADEQGEIELYFSKNTGLKVGDFTVGDDLSVLGIITLSNGLPRLQPRSAEDIKKIENIEDPESLEGADFSAASLPTTTDTLTTDLTNQENTSNKNIIFYYLLAGGIIVIGGILYFVYKNKKDPGK